LVRTFPIRDDFEPLFYDELGRLVVAAGRVEYILKLCIKSLIKTENPTTGLIEAFSKAEKTRNVGPLCSEARKLAEKLPSKDEQKAFRAVLDRIEKEMGERNNIIHAAWTTDDCRTPLRLRPRWDGNEKKLKWDKSGVVPLPCLRELRRKLEDLYSELQQQRSRWSKNGDG